MRDTEQLILAMAAVDDVLSTICREQEQASVISSSLQEQDAFTKLVDCCWTELGSSDRYVKALVRSYVSILESKGEQVSSDLLMDLIFRMSLTKEMTPHPEESCYICFRLPPCDHKLLKIRIYPYHNDVALRLWEAGAMLAEYFLQYPEYVKGKRIIELGAGVGLTGLVVAGSCGAKDVFLTDFTEACRVNMAHNILINQDWLQETRQPTAIVRQGYLEWSSFIDCSTRKVMDDLTASKEHDQTCFTAFSSADVLIAADVTYDHGTLKPLLAIVVQFLQKSPSTKKAIFAITKRNLDTFNTFIELLKEKNVAYEWIWGVQDCPPIPLWFPYHLTYTCLFLDMLYMVLNDDNDHHDSINSRSPIVFRLQPTPSTLHEHYWDALT